MEPGAYAPKQRFPSCLRHTHQVSAIKTSGHLMTHSTSRQEGLGVRLRHAERIQWNTNGIDSVDCYTVETGVGNSFSQHPRRI
jgi:hypothetical protein